MMMKKKKVRVPRVSVGGRRIIVKPQEPSFSNTEVDIYNPTVLFDDNSPSINAPVDVVIVDDEQDQLETIIQKEDREYYVVLDVESNMQDSKVSFKEQDVTEIAAYLLDKNTLSHIDSFITFVRPAIHPKLTQKYKKITGVKQSDVDSAPGFYKAIDDFRSWLYSYSGQKTICVWSKNDLFKLKYSCELYKCECPFNEDKDILDVSKMFSDSKGYKRTYNLYSGMKKARIDFEGVQHRATDDANNIVEIMRELLSLPSKS